MWIKREWILFPSPGSLLPQKHLGTALGPDEKMETVILSKTYAVPVYTPHPTRFAIHKLFSAPSRINQPAKSDKDILQAATVICAMEDKYPGDIEEALIAFPIREKQSCCKVREEPCRS